MSEKVKLIDAWDGDETYGGSLRVRKQVGNFVLEWQQVPSGPWDEIGGGVHSTIARRLAFLLEERKAWQERSEGWQERAEAPAERPEEGA